jgi:hypothetical protein
LRHIPSLDSRTVHGHAIDVQLWTYAIDVGSGQSASTVRLPSRASTLFTTSRDDRPRHVDTNPTSLLPTLSISLPYASTYLLSLLDSTRSHIDSTRFKGVGMAETAALTNVGGEEDSHVVGAAHLIPPRHTPTLGRRQMRHSRSTGAKLPRSMNLPRLITLVRPSAQPTMKSFSPPRPRHHRALISDTGPADSSFARGTAREASQYH